MKKQKVTIAYESLEQDKAEAMSRKERSESLSKLGKCLLFALIRQQYGICLSEQDLARTREGKPYLPSHPEICFNISHSGEWAMAAVSDRAIGVDLEKIRPGVRFERIAEKYFAPSDLALLKTSAQVSEEAERRTFFWCWTAVEAYGKFLGCGFLPVLSRERTEGIGSRVMPPAKEYAASIHTELEPDIQYAGKTS